MKVRTKKVIMLLALLGGIVNLNAQNLSRMNWLNEPQTWDIESPSVFTMQIPSQTDFWRITHYGFTVDDAPFYYATYAGEFETKVKITGEYVTTFDQMGLMLRIDHENWIKTGIEFVNGKQNVSTVVTHKTSDWSMVELSEPPKSIWIKALRRLDAVEISYSLDDKTYTMLRTCWLEDNVPVMVGLMGASPDGTGFKAIFEDFTVIQLPDQRRLEWAKRQQD